MTNRMYFIIAVIIALIIPIIFGGIYFADTYKYKGKSNYVYKMYDNRELLLFGETSISELNLANIDESKYMDGDMLEFSVRYATGQKEVDRYKVYLDELNLSNNIDTEHFKWRLMMYDSERDEFYYLSSGSLQDMENAKLELSSDIDISIGETQKFKLYYYLSYDNTMEYTNGEMNAKITIE